MRGSPKQIEWAEKIIAAREKELRDCPDLQGKWEEARDKVSQIGGARLWIDVRTSSARGIIEAVKASETMPALTGVSDKQIAYGESMRLQKLIEFSTMFHGERLLEVLAEMGKETSSKVWIESLVMNIASDAIQNLPKKETQTIPTEKLVNKAIAAGMNPEVARKAGELQEALLNVPKEKALLLRGLAKDAAELARLGDNKGALNLLNQALDEVKQ